MFAKKALCVWLAVSLVLTPACAHSTRIITVPEGAEVKIDNIYVGQSPVIWTSRSGTPDSAYIEISMPGYDPLKNGIIKKEYRADLSLLLLLAVFVPYFFSARYEDEYRFALKPLPGTVVPPPAGAATTPPADTTAPANGTPATTPPAGAGGR